MIAAGAGCLFDTRTPTPPATGGQCPLVTISAPDSVLSALVAAYECRGEDGRPTGSANCDAVLAEGFFFHLDADDSLEFVAQDPSSLPLLQDWNRTREIEIFNKLTEDADSIKLEMTRTGLVGSELQANYSLTTYTTGEGGVDSVAYAGRAVMQLDGSNRIVTWTDEAPTEASWGRLKYAYLRSGT